MGICVERDFFLCVYFSHQFILINWVKFENLGVWSAAEGMLFAFYGK